MMEEKVLNLSISLEKLNFEVIAENIKKVSEKSTKDVLQVEFSLNTPIIEYNTEDESSSKEDGGQSIRTTGEFFLKIFHKKNIIFKCEGRNRIIVDIFLNESEENKEKLNLSLKSAYSSYAVNELKSIMSKTNFPFPKLKIQV